jgi:HPt (histidine-containing phosphotransfer) domain-containing protein
LHVFDNCIDELKVDFLNVFKMIETVAPLRGIYDPWLVGTSVAIAVLAAFTALSIAPPLAASIRQCCERSDAEALWQAVHSLKSSAGALGAKHLLQRCAEIESRARTSGVEAAKPLVDALDDDLTAAIRGLQALIGELHAV